MAKKLEKQLEFDFMKDIRTKERLSTLLPVLRELTVMSMLTIVAGVGSYLYKSAPQIYDSIKNSVEYLF